jgi:hypothetical protein
VTLTRAAAPAIARIPVQARPTDAVFGRPDAGADVECSHCGDTARGEAQHVCEADAGVVACEDCREAHWVDCRACVAGIREALDRREDIEPGDQIVSAGLISPAYVHAGCGA